MFGLWHNGRATTNIELKIANHLPCLRDAVRQVFQRDRILLGDKTINEHLYIYSALVIAWTLNV